MALADELKGYNDAPRLAAAGGVGGPFPYINPDPEGSIDPDLFYIRTGGVAFEVVDLSPSGGGGGLTRAYPPIPTERVYPALRTERAYPV